MYLLRSSHNDFWMEKFRSIYEKYSGENFKYKDIRAEISMSEFRRMVGDGCFIRVERKPSGGASIWRLHPEVVATIHGDKYHTKRTRRV